MSASSPHVSQLNRGLIFAMAAAAGTAVANIYYNQPMLGLMERDLPGDWAGLIPTATQLGYALGLFLLVPLGDLVERKRLIIGQFFVLAIALAVSAVAPTTLFVVAASVILGVTATVAQQIVPFAAHLAPPERRGAIVGNVMAGILCGILLSRTLAGFVAAHYGWRAMFWLGVPLAIFAGLSMWLKLPRSASDLSLSYGQLMGSMGRLWRELPQLRLAAITQGLMFAAFSVFWTVLAFQLESPAFQMGSEVVGLFGVVGAVGILAAPIVGRIADKHGPHRGVLVGAVLTLTSWLVFALWVSLPGLVVGVIVLDLAAQGVLVSNQHIIYALRPEARARINTIFMSGMFLGGAAGSALAIQAWTMGGWPLVSLLGIVLGAATVTLQAINFIRHKHMPAH
jgi:predicted MFS family arabinose efflux permease